MLRGVTYDEPLGLITRVGTSYAAYLIMVHAS